MGFRFGPRKTLQAAALLLRAENPRCPRMNCMRLLKLLYVADRECLRLAGNGPEAGRRMRRTTRRYQPQMNADELRRNERSPSVRIGVHPRFHGVFDFVAFPLSVPV